MVPCMVVADASLVPHIKGILESAGIPHFVKNEAVQNLIGWGSGMFGFNPITGAPVVMVEASRLEEATGLLRDFTKSVRGSTPDPVRSDMPSACPRCRGGLQAEEGEPALSHCYHCGWPLA